MIGPDSMRGEDSKQATTFSMLSPQRRVPPDHPLRPVKAMTDVVLSSMSKRFDRMYSSVGRPSIPPERLLKAEILIALYSVRGDRMSSLLSRNDPGLLARNDPPRGRAVSARGRRWWRRCAEEAAVFRVSTLVPA